MSYPIYHFNSALLSKDYVNISGDLFISGDISSQQINRLNNSINNLSSSLQTIDISTTNLTVQNILGDTIRIGNNTSTIYIGQNGSQVYIDTSINYVSTNNLDISDNVIRLNKGGVSASNSGIEIYRNNIPFANIKISNDQTKWTLQNPNSDPDTIITQRTIDNIDNSLNIAFTKLNNHDSSLNTSFSRLDNHDSSLNLAFNRLNNHDSSLNNLQIKVNTIDISTTNLTVANNLNIQGMQVSGDIIPTNDLSYNLGSENKRFHSLYVGPGSIYLGDAKITSTAGALDLSNINIDKLSANTLNVNNDLCGNIIYANALYNKTSNLYIGDYDSNINIGKNGSTVNITGTIRNYITNNTDISDTVITLNKNGYDANNCGILVNANNNIKAYIKTDTIGDNWVLKAPNMLNDDIIITKTVFDNSVNNINSRLNIHDNSFNRLDLRLDTIDISSTNLTVENISSTNNSIKIGDSNTKIYFNNTRWVNLYVPIIVSLNNIVIPNGSEPIPMYKDKNINDSGMDGWYWKNDNNNLNINWSPINSSNSTLILNNLSEIYLGIRILSNISVPKIKINTENGYFVYKVNLNYDVILQNNNYLFRIGLKTLESNNNSFQNINLILDSSNGTININDNIKSISIINDVNNNSGDSEFIVNNIGFITTDITNNVNTFLFTNANVSANYNLQKLEALYQQLTKTSILP